MEIEKLSRSYGVRRLGDSDIADILRLCMGNPLYYQHCPPAVSEESIRRDMAALPPNKTAEDKYYLGFFDGEELVAVLDLILGFPNEKTAFIGFFMMAAERQGCGAGSQLIGEMCGYLRDYYAAVRLGYVKGNLQSEHFWLRNGFEPTGVISHTDDYDIVVLEKAIG